MLTGQISSQALQLVQAQISSAVIRSNTESAVTVSSASWPTTGLMGPPGWVAAMTWPTLRTISRGSSGLPVAWAGHTDGAAPADGAGVGVEQLLPGEVLDGVGPEGLQLGLGQVGQRLHRPLGPVPVPEVHVERRREHVAQLGRRHQDDEGEEGQHVDEPRPLVGDLQLAAVRARRRRRRAGSRRTATSRTPGRPTSAMRMASVVKPVTPMTRKVPRMTRVLGPGLDPDPVGPLDVAADDGPDDADQEQHAGGVADQRVGLVDLAVEELGAARQQVVDLVSTVVTANRMRNGK